MGWLDDIFGGDNSADANQANARPSRDPLGRIFAEPAFDAFRSAWKAGAKLFDLFGDDPVTIEEPVGPDKPNRRADVAKVETFLDRTGHLDLAKTEGPTGYYGSRVDQGIRRFQKDNALRVDGLINPNGPTLGRIGASLSEIAGDGADQPWRTPGFNPDADRPRNAREPGDDTRPSTSSPSLFDRVSEWFDNRTSDTLDRADGSVPIARRNTSDLSPKALGDSRRTPSAHGQSSEDPPSEPEHVSPVLDKIEDFYRGYARGFRRRGMPQAAANLEHFLNGSGDPRQLPRDEAIKLKPVQEAEATNNARFANRTFRGISKENEEVKKLPLLREGDEPLHFNEEWERDFEMGDFLWNAAFGDRDFAAALGRAKFRSEGDFKAVRIGGSISITGTVVHRLADPYDFHPWQPGAEGALALQRYRGAKPFSFETEWHQPVRAVVPVKGNKLGKPKVEWGDITE
jgi:peptidoglycan hydrolase-like protein with peptidoglycan-binding domain